jgi:hypothetical protein
MGDTTFMSTTSFWSNVEMIRVNDGAARAPHETCLWRTSDPMIGSALSFVVSD